MICFLISFPQSSVFSCSYPAKRLQIDFSSKTARKISCNLSGHKSPSGFAARKTREQLFTSSFITFSVTSHYTCHFTLKTSDDEKNLLPFSGNLSTSSLRWQFVFHKIAFRFKFILETIGKNVHKFIMDGRRRDGFVYLFCRNHILILRAVNSLLMAFMFD